MNFAVIFFTLFWSLFSLHTKAQNNDYDSLALHMPVKGCGVTDTASLNKNRAFLESLDTQNITRNLHKYYYDLGMQYYILSALSSNKNTMQHAAQCFEASFHHQNTYWIAFYNLAVCKSLMHDCATVRDCAAYFQASANRNIRRKMKNEWRGLQSNCSGKPNKI